jgi:hypothetical protein
MRTGKSALILFLFLVVVVPFSWFTVIIPYKSAASFFNNAPKMVDSSLTKQFPADLVISVKNGLLSLNRPSPYCLILKEGSKIGIIFDTKSDPQVKAFETDSPYSRFCQPIAVVGNNYLMLMDNGRLNIQPIPTQLNYTLDQTTLSGLVSNYLPKLISYGRNVYLYLPFLLIIPVFIFFLLNNYWYSFVSRLILKLFKIRPGIKLSEVYGISLFFYTCINFLQWVVIGYLLNHLSKLNVIISFPFMNTILIVIACIIYFKNQSVPPVIVPPTIPPPLDSASAIQFKTVLPPPGK